MKISIQILNPKFSLDVESSLDAESQDEARDETEILYKFKIPITKTF